MTLDISLSDKEVSTDPIAALFRVSAIVSDHVTRVRQSHVNKEIDLGQGVKGRIVAVDYKTITIKSSNGERRTVPMTTKRAAMLAHDSSTTEARPASVKRGSPRKQPHTPQAGSTTRK
tara:strand:+ start:8636 stop:8989 length:354 start_codon:yes stop_codon:yes gene_type:complete